MRRLADVRVGRGSAEWSRELLRCTMRSWVTVWARGGLRSVEMRASGGERGSSSLATSRCLACSRRGAVVGCDCAGGRQAALGLCRGGWRGENGASPARPRRSPTMVQAFDLVALGARALVRCGLCMSCAGSMRASTEERRCESCPQRAARCACAHSLGPRPAPLARAFSALGSDDQDTREGAHNLAMQA